MFCPQCGKYLDAQSQFCKHCGESISDDGNILVAKERQPLKVEQTSRSGVKGKHTVSIVLGLILLIAGLLIAIMYKDIAVGMVGSDRIMKEAFFGGSSFKDTATIVLVVGIGGLIAGGIFLAYGLTSAQKTKD